ncbi:hypothetical protein ACSCBZ_39440 [Streptomyces niveiscabiei]|uniref:hypothetical protein n=1 Tax=Streptomyces niveiscabiei TaxID=164115 RepID=UPI0006EB852F|nr:hypothetical protein [Streptomyces niveiscabiei]
MTTETGSRITEGRIGGSVDMLTYMLLEGISGEQPFTEAYDDELDCGTMRVRIRIEVEPTGLTPEQAGAAVVADDPAEPPHVRAAARRVMAGGPGLEDARALLSSTGPWPFP